MCLRDRANELASCLYTVADAAREHGLERLAADIDARAFRIGDWAAGR